MGSSSDLVGRTVETISSHRGARPSVEAASWPATGVRARIDPSPRLLALAALQAGVLTSEQTSGSGLPQRSVERLLGAGEWRPLTRGLYLVHDQEPGWTAWAWAGVLLGGADARLGGQAAAHLYALDDPPRELEVMVPWSKPASRRWPWRFVRERPGVRSPRSPGDPPRLTIEDVVIDLSERCSGGELVDLITRAVQSRKTTALRLARCAARRARLRHRKLLLQLLVDTAEGAQSALELHYLRDVERAHGLPRGERQARADYGNFWQDVRYRKFRVVVELDGRLGHDGVEHFRDMSRDNAGVVSGSVTLRYGWHDTLERPCAMAFQIAGVLIRQGWDGLPIRCPRCVNMPDGEIG